MSTPSTIDPRLARQAGSKGDRRGAGVILVIGAVFLLVMALIGLSQSFLASQVGDIATRATLGRVAQLAAESTIEEARGVLALRANTTGNALFTMLRPHPTPGSWQKLGSVDLALADLPQAAQSFQSLPLNEYELVGPVRLTFYYQRRTSYSVGNDLEETAELHARVRYIKEHSVVRDVTETVALRVSKMTPLQPLPKVAALVRRPVQIAIGTARGDDPSDCGSAGVCVDRFIADLLDNRVPTIRREVTNIINQLNTKKDQNGVTQMLAAYTRIINDPADGGKDHIKIIEDYKARFTPYPPVSSPPDQALLICPGPSLDLDRLNLQRHMNKLAGMYAQSLTDLKNADARVQAATSDPSAAVAAHQAYTDVLLQQLKIIFSVMHFAKDFQLVANQVTSSGSAKQTYGSLEYLTGLVEDTQLAKSWSVAAQSATLVVAEDPPGPDHRAITDKVKDLLARIDPAGAGVNAILNVMNRTEPLTLQGVYAGKLILYVSGPCTIDNAQSKGPDDTLMIVALGGSSDVEVKGTVKACLALDAAHAVIPQGATVTGTLILDDVSASRPEDMRGKVEVDPRLATAPEDKVTYVTVSPWVRTRVVERR